ncbi:MAG TPA: hypothetical protein VK527_00910 [Candidatus Limnocylindrales bacterium]|jgi:hypothetical protein|nr:hypothetical protein [Candidatus Limnocylindrales bacterium]
MARASIREAWREFRWPEYRPFAWIMLAELVFIGLASSLGTAWGMKGAGWIMRTAGEPALHYPASFLFLSYAYARVEAVLFAVAGSFLIPLSLARIAEPEADAASPARLPTAGRALRAYPATFMGFLLSFALLVAWEYLLPLGPSRWLHAFRGGIIGDLLTWIVGVLVAFAIAAIFVYVPVRAVSDGGSFGKSLIGGIGEGLRTLGPTLFIVLLFACPTLIFLAPVQLVPTLLVARFHPELIAILIAIAAVLNSFVNYLIYSAVARFHWHDKRRDG